ncbi:DUF5995 family protein [Mycobacterium paraterrae]|uniref:DUF5995 family protein n=1 Tax=Mycobacterium paraterrae TaxID=577492 RepID=A0ABY3VP94_9MYCO|nr:DUF5995 family protein [Mycobacterium paraterrae]UMB69323.1 DUF5995 family protein [Mycobacterium paraterrae]
MATTAAVLPPIPTVTTIDEVVDAIESIIDWSISQSSRLGYFAAMYKRITIAIGAAVSQGMFEDGPRLQRFDAIFATRYFDALNGLFHPAKFPAPTRSWHATFDAAIRPEPIIAQHLLAGVNAHIDLDLGIAARSTAPGADLPALHNDFNTVNAVLASQVRGVVTQLDEVSPVLADIYHVLSDNEIFVINEVVKNLRDSAWTFAEVLNLEPKIARPITISARDLQVSAQGDLIYDPPGLIGLLRQAVAAIAARESRDVVANIRALDEIAATPAPITSEL